MLLKTVELELCLWLFYYSCPTCDSKPSLMFHLKTLDVGDSPVSALTALQNSHTTTHFMHIQLYDCIPEITFTSLSLVPNLNKILQGSSHCSKLKTNPHKSDLSAHIVMRLAGLVFRSFRCSSVSGASRGQRVIIKDAAGSSSASTGSYDYRPSLKGAFQVGWGNKTSERRRGRMVIGAACLPVRFAGSKGERRR